MGHRQQVNERHLATPRLVTEAEAAAILSTTPGTLKQDRHAGGFGLPFVRLGRAIRYDLAEIERYIEANTVRPDEAA